MSTRHPSGLFEVQYGLATNQQLARAGLTRAKLRTLESHGLYERLGPSVYGLAGTPDSILRQVQLALMLVGDRAVVSHRTAAYMLGFDTFGPGRIELMVPYDRRVPGGAFVLHRTRRLDSTDVTRVKGLRTTSAARTIIDLAACVTERELMNAVASAIRDGRTSYAHLHRRLAALRGPGRHGVVALARLLEQMPGGGLHSVLEVDFFAISLAVFPVAPITQMEVTIGGRRYRVDFAYPPSPVIVEVEGHGAHATGPQRTADSRRARDLVAAGYQVVPFTSFEVFHQPELVADHLRRALAPHFPGQLLR